MTSFTSRWNNLPILDRDVNPNTDNVIEWGVVTWREDEHGKYMAQQAIVEVRKPGEFPGYVDHRGYARIGMETLNRSLSEGNALIVTAKRNEPTGRLLSGDDKLGRLVSNFMDMFKRTKKKVEAPPEREP